MTFNSVELHSFNRFERGMRVTYGYSIERDRSGREVSRTEPVRLSAIGWSDGSNFTQDDEYCVANGIAPKRKRLLCKIAALFSFLFLTACATTGPQQTESDRVINPNYDSDPFPQNTAWKTDFDACSRLHQRDADRRRCMIGLGWPL